MLWVWLHLCLLWLGSPKVTRIYLAEASDENEVLQLAASLEAGSEHPLALSIVESAKDRDLVPEQAEKFQAIAGHGVEGVVRGHRLFFGNEKLMRDQSIDIEPHIETAQLMAKEAQTPIYLAVDGKLAAIIAVSDQGRLHQCNQAIAEQWYPGRDAHRRQ